MDIKKMINDYSTWLKMEITITTHGEYVELTTPYMDRFNDYLQIYATQNTDGTITLTDDGFIIKNLISSGMTFKKGSSRQKLIEGIAKKFNISICNDAITTSATVNNFPQKKHMMVQAMLAIDDLFVLSTTSIKDFFLEEVENYFQANEIFYSKDFSLLGKTETLYTYDFHLQRTKKKPERFCRGFNRLNLSKRDLTLFNWLDTKEKRKDSSELIVVYNDEHSVTDEILKGFDIYEIKTVPFSKRNESSCLELFVA
jgi:hypothetical protein